MLGCMFFVFCSLIELAAVGRLGELSRIGHRGSKRKRRKNKVKLNPPTILRDSLDCFCVDENTLLGIQAGPIESTSLSAPFAPTTEEIWAERIDVFSGFFFPGTFALFNIIYWGYYLQ